MTIGEIAAASISTSASNSAPSSLGRRRHSATAASKSAGAPGRPSTHSKVVSSGAIMPARPPPSIVMLQIVIRFSIERRRIASPGVLDRVPDHAADAQAPDRGQDQVLGRDARAQPPE